MSLTIPPSFQFALDKSNAGAVKQVTLEEYAQARLNDLGESYAQQEAQQHDAALAALSPEDKARVAKLAEQPQDVQDKFAALVDALP